MATDQITEGCLFHDRLTRGEKLTLEEQQILMAWYHEQDRAESLLLEQQTLPTDLATLRVEIEAAIKQLALLDQQRSLLEEQRALIALLLQQQRPR